MDVNELRTIITIVSLLLFLIIVYWAYSSRQKSRFEEAANLPFADDDMQQRTIDSAQQSSDLSNRKSGEQ
ncbi:MAG: cbb3-type cytochrome c oxidase subunit 3 [Granulosicoccus sp.]